MTDWRFYGRKTELGNLDLALRHPIFACQRIHDRRGIGKSEFVAEAARRSGGKSPVLIFELRSPELEFVDAARQRLLDITGNAL